MSFTVTSLFVNDIQLSGQVTGTTEFASFIDRIEKMYLEKFFGYDLYNKLITGIATPTQKYVDIRDGKDFTVTDSQGRTVNVRWRGLASTERPMLAYFIYYEWLKRQTYNSASGQRRPDNENSQYEQSLINQSMIAAYNNGIEIYGADMNFLTGKHAIRRGREYVNRVYYRTKRDYLSVESEEIKGTLSNFIYQMNQVNGDDYYPNWNFTELSKINTLGL